MILLLNFKPSQSRAVNSLWSVASTYFLYGTSATQILIGKVSYISERYHQSGKVARIQMVLAF